MLGYNDSEGIMMLDAAFKHIEKYEKDLARMIPRSLDVPLDQADSLSTADAIRDLYFNGRTIDKASIKEMTALQTDYHFGIHSVMTAELHARIQHRFLFLIILLSINKLSFGFTDVRYISIVSHLTVTTTSSRKIYWPSLP